MHYFVREHTHLRLDGTGRTITTYTVREFPSTKPVRTIGGDIWWSSRKDIAYDVCAMGNAQRDKEGKVNATL